MADISKIKLPNNSEYNIRDNSKLPKTVCEYNKELSFGSSDKLCIGKFPCYDTNITIDIDSTTNTTYHGTLVIATQNINTEGGGDIEAKVYGDAANTVTPNLYIKYVSGSRNVEVYFNPPAWSKNFIHIRMNPMNYGEPTDVVTSISSIPSDATRRPVNALDNKQNKLESGTNIKTINGASILGSGDITVSGSDEKVKTTARSNTNKIYLSGTQNASGETAAQVFDSNVSIGTSAGELCMKKINLDGEATISWNSSTSSIDFVF